MSVILSNPRDVREFVDAKRRKREPIRCFVDGVAAAKCEPQTLAEFDSLRFGLRDCADFGCASDRLDALENALFRRHMKRLPKPRKIVQNSDRSLTIWWNGAFVRCFADGFVSFIGGANGLPAREITTELLDVLAQAGKVT